MNKKKSSKDEDWLSRFKLSGKSKGPTSTSTTATPTLTMTQQQQTSVDGDGDDGDCELIEHVNLQNSVTISIIKISQWYLTKS